MCGIVCLFDAETKTDALRPQILEMSKKLDTAVQIGAEFSNQKNRFSHERLAIVDPTSGKQPLFTKDGKVVLSCEWRNLQPLRTQKRIP